MVEEFPEKDMEITHILVVKDTKKSREFYSNILGAELFREYGSSIVYKFLESWLLLVEEGEPTKDKPDVDFVSMENKNKVSHAMTIRVKDCHKSYNVLRKRGAEFITGPVEYDNEIRCFFRDFDGHLFEISQAK